MNSGSTHLLGANNRDSNDIIWTSVFVSAYCCSTINCGWSFTVNVSSCLSWWFLARISNMVDKTTNCKHQALKDGSNMLGFVSHSWFFLILYVSDVGYSTTMKYMKLITRSFRMQLLVSYLGLPACWAVYQPAVQTQFPPAPLQCPLPQTDGKTRPSTGEEHRQATMTFCFIMNYPNI